MTRTCVDCGETKAIDDFPPSRGKPQYRQRRCRECARRITRDQLRRYRATPEGRARTLASVIKYRKTPKGRAVWQRYIKGPKGRAAKQRDHARYIRTPEGKACLARKNHQRRVRVAAVPNNLTADEWQEILVEHDFRCAYCNVRFSKQIPPTRDHVIPVVAGGGLTRDNIVPACARCNASKGTHPEPGGQSPGHFHNHLT